MSRALPPPTLAPATRGSPCVTRWARGTSRAARVNASSTSHVHHHRRVVGFSRARRGAHESLVVRAAADPDPESEVGAMVELDAIRALLDSDPAVREQEEKIATEARNAASLLVDKRRNEEQSQILEEISGKRTEASEELFVTQTEALAAFEARSAAVVKAEAKMREIQMEKQALEAKAKASGVVVVAAPTNVETSSEDADAERVESAKAGCISAIAGTLVSAPSLLIRAQTTNAFVPLESLGGAFVSCLLFGVVYRYAVRDDLGNVQLKAGVVAAFGLTRGLGAADVYLHGSDTSQIATWLEAALVLGEAMLTFAFAFAALEYALRNGFVQPRRK